MMLANKFCLKSAVQCPLFCISSSLSLNSKTHIHLTFLHMQITYNHCPHFDDRVAKVLDCGLETSEFVFQLHNYVHFWTNAFGNYMKLPLFLQL